ncbi:MAG TPA: hypothetical protein PKC25_07635, partial [Candidatus Rifleibacterium sp.]|nr:hypothetical protein [Candidatus Rifleibacterium sp.]
MKKTFLFTAVTFLLAGSVVVGAENAGDAKKAAEAPWLEGVTIGEHPVDLSPVLPMKIYLENGEAIPATLTEDVPLFDAEPPATYNGSEIPNPSWSRNPAISWLFIDWEKNRNIPASASQDLAINQMVITPLNPTGKGAITCYAGRKMRYTSPETGKARATFANSSIAADVRVLDITPPVCGLEVSLENPPHKYPLPKMADVYFSGALVNEADPTETLTVPGVELGANMVVVPDQAAITVPANAVLKIKANGDDNYKLDNTKLKYGICAGAG